MAFSRDGKWLASGSDDKTVRLWDTSTLKATDTPEPISSVLIGHTDKVKSVAFSPDSKQIITGGDDQSLRLWNISLESLLHTACTQLQHHSSLAHPKPGVVKEASETCQAYVWD